MFLSVYEWLLQYVSSCHAKIIWHLLMGVTLRYRWIYSSSLAYIVDANNGRASTASACNSAFRRLFAFISTEVAVPLQVDTRINLSSIPSKLTLKPFTRTDLGMVGLLNLLNHSCNNTLFICFLGWMYTVWAGVVLLGGICILTVAYKGEAWRLAAERREEAYEQSLDDASTLFTKATK